jgi:hypothetical protein
MIGKWRIVKETYAIQVVNHPFYATNDSNCDIYRIELQFLKRGM